MAWAPSAADRAAYQSLWAAISSSRQPSDRLPAHAGAHILAASGLPKQSLACIWAIADGGDKGYLSEQEFYTALRLVAMAQADVEVLEPGVAKAALVAMARMPLPPPALSLPTAAAAAAAATNNDDDDGFDDFQAPSAATSNSGVPASSAVDDDFGDFSAPAANGATAATAAAAAAAAAVASAAPKASPVSDPLNAFLSANLQLAPAASSSAAHTLDAAPKKPLSMAARMSQSTTSEMAKPLAHAPVAPTSMVTAPSASRSALIDDLFSMDAGDHSNNSNVSNSNAAGAVATPLPANTSSKADDDDDFGDFDAAPVSAVASSLGTAAVTTPIANAPLASKFSMKPPLSAPSNPVDADDEFGDFDGPSNSNSSTFASKGNGAQSAVASIDDGFGDFTASASSPMVIGTAPALAGGFPPTAPAGSGGSSSGGGIKLKLPSAASFAAHAPAPAPVAAAADTAFNGTVGPSPPPLPPLSPQEDVFGAKVKIEGLFSNSADEDSRDIAIVQALSLVTVGLDRISGVISAVQNALGVGAMSPSSFSSSTGNQQPLQPQQQLPPSFLREAVSRLSCCDELLTRGLVRLDSLPRTPNTADLRRGEVRRANALAEAVEVCRAVVTSLGDGAQQQTPKAAAAAAVDMFAVAKGATSDTPQRLSFSSFASSPAPAPTPAADDPFAAVVSTIAAPSAVLSAPQAPANDDDDGFADFQAPSAASPAVASFIAPAIPLPMTHVPMVPASSSGKPSASADDDDDFGDFDGPSSSVKAATSSASTADDDFGDFGGSSAPSVAPVVPAATPAPSSLAITAPVISSTSAALSASSSVPATSVSAIGEAADADFGDFEESPSTANDNNNAAAASNTAVSSATVPKAGGGGLLSLDDALSLALGGGEADAPAAPPIAAAVATEHALPAAVKAPSLPAASPTVISAAHLSTAATLSNAASSTVKEQEQDDENDFGDFDDGGASASGGATSGIIDVAAFAASPTPATAPSSSSSSSSSNAAADDDFGDFDGPISSADAAAGGSASSSASSLADFDAPGAASLISSSVINRLPSGSSEGNSSKALSDLVTLCTTVEAAALHLASRIASASSSAASPSPDDGSSSGLRRAVVEGLRRSDKLARVLETIRRAASSAATSDPSAAAQVVVVVAPHLARVRSALAAVGLQVQI